MAQTQLLPRDLELPLDLRLPRVGAVDAVALEARAADLAKRSIKKGSKVAGLKLAIRMMDLTTLEGAGHGGQGGSALREGAPPTRARPVVGANRRGLRLSEHGRRAGRARRHGRSRRSRGDAFPERAVPPLATARDGAVRSSRR